ncbi:MAG: hypothetical protein RIS31_876 [Actinomycetota bacterium]
MNLKLVFAAASLTLTLAGCTGNQTHVIEDPASWTTGVCTKEQPGVTLSIDFKGQVTTRCALNFDGNGWDLFQKVGFSVKGTAKYPTAFACQINDEPKEAKCDDSDMSGAYWGYYVATDGHWDYATTGASDHHAICGESEGWVYMETEKTESNLPAPTAYACK